MNTPFRVNALWVYYAHGPGSEDGQPAATALVDLIPADDSPVLVRDRALVEEIISVAGLYTRDSDVQHDDRLWFRGYPANVIRRGRVWLKANQAAA